mgnify:FL=1
MLVITDDEVILTRGDSADINVKITDANGDIYTPAEGDVIKFTLKKNCETSDIIIQKTLVNSVISLQPADTKDLPYGTYYFDVQLTTAGADVYTVVSPHRFIIDKEVTFNA